MTVEVRLFASLAERAGRAVATVDVPEDATVATLWDAVVASHPGLADWTSRPLAACDLEYAAWDTPVAGVEEVAFLPPVSGG